jgi:hypothetical protein
MALKQFQSKCSGYILIESRYHKWKFWIELKENFMRHILLGSLVSTLLLSSAYAQGFGITITVDENGNGTFTNTNGFFSPLPGALAPDPGPGGLPVALTYDLLNPPGLVAGDLLLFEPRGGGEGLSDIVRFNLSSPTPNGTGSLVFYSDHADSGQDLADTGFPTGAYPNRLTVTEIGSEGANGFTYTPTAGQPGFVAGAAGPVTYVLESDVPAVPEPSTLIPLAGICGILLVALTKRKVSLPITQTKN